MAKGYSKGSASAAAEAPLAKAQRVEEYYSFCDVFTRKNEDVFDEYKGVPYFDFQEDEIVRPRTNYFLVPQVTPWKETVRDKKFNKKFASFNAEIAAIIAEHNPRAMAAAGVLSSAAAFEVGAAAAAAHAPAEEAGAGARAFFAGAAAEQDQVGAGFQQALEQPETQDEASTAQTVANLILASLMTKISELFGDIALEERERQAQWEAALKQHLATKYQFCAQSNDFRNIEEFCSALFRTAFYKAIDENNNPLGEDEKRNNFAQIKAAADLQDCAGGAIGALDNLFISTISAGSFWGNMEEKMVQMLTPYCLSGNQTHLSSWLKFLASNDLGQDEHLFAAASDMTMEDVRRTLYFLTFQSGFFLSDLMAKEIMRINREVKLNIFLQAKDLMKGPQNSDKDSIQKAIKTYYERRPESYRKDQYCESLLSLNYDDETIAKMSELFNLKEYEKQVLADPIKFYKIFRETLYFESKFFENIELLCDQSSYPMLRDQLQLFKKLSEQKSGTEKYKFARSKSVELLETTLDAYGNKVNKLKEIDEDTEEFIHIILLINSYTAKNMPIPAWLQDQISDFLEIDNEESQIIKKLEELADNISREFNITIKLLKVRDPRNPDKTTVKFCRSLSKERMSHSVQDLVDAGEDITVITSAIKTSKRQGLTIDRVSVAGLLFHPDQDKILNLLAKKIQIIDYDDALIRAIVLGDVAFIRLLGDVFKVHELGDESLPMKWHNDELTMPRLTFPHLDLLYQSLKGQITTEDLRTSFRAIFTTVIGQDMAQNNVTLFQNLMETIDDKAGFLKWIVKNLAITDLLFAIDWNNDTELFVNIITQIQHKNALDYLGQAFIRDFDTLLPEDQQKSSNLIYNIAIHLTNQDRTEESIPFLTIVAELGNTDAQENLFIAYWNKQTGDRLENLKQAFEWCVKAYEGGKKDYSCKALAVLYYDGEVVERNIIESKRLFLEAKGIYEEKLKYSTQKIETAGLSQELVSLHENEIDHYTESIEAISETLQNIEKELGTPATAASHGDAEAAFDNQHEGAALS